MRSWLLVSSTHRHAQPDAEQMREKRDQLDLYCSVWLEQRVRSRLPRPRLGLAQNRTLYVSVQQF